MKKFNITLLSVLIIIFGVTLTSNNSANAQECNEICPPAEYVGGDWSKCGYEVTPYEGNPNCLIHFHYCIYYPTGDFAPIVYISEIASFKDDPPCFTENFMLTRFNKLVEMCVNHLLLIKQIFDNPQETLKNCEEGYSGVVQVGHPKCVTDIYHQRVLVIQVLKEVMTESIAVEWGSSVGLTAAPAIPSVEPTESDMLESIDIIDADITNNSIAGNSIKNIGPATEKTIQIVSPCRDDEPDDICWATFLYCWEYVDGVKVLKNTKLPIQTVTTICPPEKRVAVTAGGLGNATKWANVGCNLICFEIP